MSLLINMYVLYVLNHNNYVSDHRRYKEYPCHDALKC